MIAKLRDLGADSYLTKSSDPRKMYKEIKDVMSSDLQATAVSAVKAEKKVPLKSIHSL